MNPQRTKGDCNANSQVEVEVESQGNYVPSYNFSNFNAMIDQQNYNQYFLNLNLLTGKPYLPPGRIPMPRENGVGPLSWSTNSSSPGFGLPSSYLDYLLHMESMRVAMIEYRRKMYPQVINLDSDEEQPTTRCPAPATTAMQAMELDEHSQEKTQKTMKPSVPASSCLVNVCPQKLDTTIQKSDSFEAKKKELFEDIKTKRIQKPFKKLKKSQGNSHSDLDLKPSSKQKQESYWNLNFNAGDNQNQRTKKEDNKNGHGWKNGNQHKYKKNFHSSDFIVDIDKNYNVPQQKQQKTIDTSHLKQIAKYMQSHGQIRHGKEFQSDLPICSMLEPLCYIRWIQDKRKNLLKREVGVLTV